MSARDSRYLGCLGFTLIELMVVMLILGLLSSLVVLTTAPDLRREASTEATRLGLVLQAALQETQWSGRPMAFSAEGRAYRFWAADEQARWLSIADGDKFRPRSLSEGMGIVSIEVEGQTLPAGALLTFTPAHATLFQITLDAPQGKMQLRSLPNSRVHLVAP